MNSFAEDTNFILVVTQKDFIQTPKLELNT